MQINCHDSRPTSCCTKDWCNLAYSCVQRWGTCLATKLSNDWMPSSQEPWLGKYRPLSVKQVASRLGRWFSGSFNSTARQVESRVEGHCAVPIWSNVWSPRLMQHEMAKLNLLLCHSWIKGKRKVLEPFGWCSLPFADFLYKFPKSLGTKSTLKKPEWRVRPGFW